MRVSCAALALSAMGLLLSFAGSVAAQDTNFATGPQYLATQGSPLFARPISTPSLSLGTQMEEPTEHAATAEPHVELPIPPAKTQSGQPPQVDFFAFYYGSPLGENFGQAVPEPELEPVERQSSANIFETGVSQSLDAQAIRRLGYGPSLAEQAAQRKKRDSAARRYTNEDVERLR